MNLWADFNEIEDDDIIGTTLLNTEGLFIVPRPGETVTLQDDDGSTCWAVVLDVADGYLTCRLLRETWRDPAPAPRFEPAEYHFVTEATYSQQPTLAIDKKFVMR